MPEIRMPKMGDGMEEGTVLRWLKREGDSIAVDEAIAEIETDKANVEMPAEEAGTLTKIIVKEGETVPVGAVMAHIGSVTESSRSGNGGHPAEPPAGQKSALSRTSSRGAVSPGPSEQKSHASAEPPAGGLSRERVKATPLARKTAREFSVDLAQIHGTGPGGQIKQRDVLASQEKGRQLAVASATTPIPAAEKRAPAPETGDVEISRMRKTIARRTVQSVQTSPHFYITTPVEMDRAVALLEEMNGAMPEQKLTVNDLIVKASAVALETFPDVNVSYTPEDRIRKHAQINIGIAVVSDEGLTMPVVTDCGSKTLRRISVDARSLIQKARSGALTPQEMSGGTFSVSNLGMFGVEEFTAIINQPESAILAVGAVLPEVVASEDGGFSAKKRMRLTLSCDHRSVDGVLGARFLQEVKRLLESPLALLE
jgi:pyruvate dehydrogenase E2 component (dihydrolipoamide acetyltransferase)